MPTSDRFIREVRPSGIDENDYGESDEREARRDRDRILGSASLRRLSGITQVISPDGRYPIHNRLTHTLEVAHIAKRIVEKLLNDNHDQGAIERAGGLNIDVVEAASLAHDIGHPPFGHVAEVELNRLASEAGLSSGFEGNAQSFRVLTRLEVKDDEGQGLNLTPATLSAVSKYPWPRKGNDLKPSKWGCYSTEPELQTLRWSRAHLSQSIQTINSEEPSFDIRTLEAQIMDLADDIAYTVYDLDDFCRIGVIPYRTLRYVDEERENFLQYHFIRQKIRRDKQDEVREIFDNLLGFFPDSGAYDGSHESQAQFGLFTARLQRDFVSKLSLKTDSILGARLKIQPDDELKLALLKDLLWRYLIEGSAMASQRAGQRRLISYLFNTLCILRDDKFSKESNRKWAERFSDSMIILPEPHRRRIEKSDYDDTVIIRSVVDFIAALTEPQVLSLYNRFTGSTLGSALDPIVM